MEDKINACKTLAELAELERTRSLNEEERRLVFERRLWMFLRIHDWREKNERLGLEPTISDFWTAEQRETYLRDWLDDSEGSNSWRDGSNSWRETHARRSDR